jgi:hypothetical protein
MNENETVTNGSNEDQVQNGKEISYYSQMLAGYFASSMELDKSLIQLSVLGVAVTLFMTLSNITNFLQLVILFVALCSFLTTIIAVLINYKNNQKVVLSALSDKKDYQAINQKLKAIGKLAHSAFFVGVLCFGLTAVSSAFLKLIN